MAKQRRTEGAGVDLSDPAVVAAASAAGRARRIARLDASLAAGQMTAENHAREVARVRALATVAPTPPKRRGRFWAAFDRIDRIS